MTVLSDIYSMDIIVPKIYPDDILVDAARALNEYKSNALAVIDKNHRLVGIVTDHDIIKTVATRHEQLQHVTVKEVMSKNVVTCRSETHLTDALRLMGTHSIRHLVVVMDAQVKAVISVKDILSKIHSDDELEISVLRDVAASVLVAQR